MASKLIIEKQARLSNGAKGDLIVGANSSGDVENLAVGANGEVLRAASGETLGLEWGAVAASEVAVTPAGSIAATDVQAALVELDTDIAGKAATSHAHAGTDITSGTVAAARLPLLQDLSGVLDIASGGTGQANQTAAFDALAPSTTKGDLLVDDGTNVVRLAVGSNAQLLSSNSGETTGLEWVDPPSGTVPGGTVGQKLSYITGNVLDNVDWVILAEDYGAVGDDATDDTTALQNAIDAAVSTGFPLWLQKTYKITASLTVSGAITMDGGGTIKLYAASGTILQWAAQADGTTTGFNQTTTRLSRATSVLADVDVDSAAGFTEGDYVELKYADGSYTFRQMTILKTIVSDNLEFVDPVMIPVNASQADTVIEKNFHQNIVVRNLTLDGSNATTSIGILCQGFRDCLFENLRIQFITAGIAAGPGYNNVFRNIHLYQCGDGGNADINLVALSNSVIENIRSVDATGFGPIFSGLVNCQFGNITSTGAVGRAIKFEQCGFCNGTNIVASKSGATGFSVALGCWANKFHNVTAHDNTDQGVWFGSDENIFNLIDGVSAYSNVGGDVTCTSTDYANHIRNANVGTFAHADAEALSGSVINRPTGFMLFDQGADVVVQNTTTETEIKAFTVEANTIPAGRAYRVTLNALYAAESTEFPTVRLYRGGTQVFAFVCAAGVTSSSPALFEFLVGIKGVPGASASGFAIVNRANSHAGSIINANHPPTDFTWDTTTDLEWRITVQWNATGAGNVFRQRGGFLVEVVH